jgi:hypothetical protein
VRATDLETGREQHVQIKLVGAVDDEEVQRMMKRQSGVLGQKGRGA